MKLLVAALALLVSQTANAAILTATVTGQFTSGTDFSGLFGAAGSDLTGRAISIAYRIDTTRGTRSTTDESDTLYGGIATPGSQSPIVSQIITINGVDRPFGSDWDSTVYQAISPFGIDRIFFLTYDNRIDPVTQTRRLDDVTVVFGGRDQFLSSFLIGTPVDIGPSNLRVGSIDLRLARTSAVPGEFDTELTRGIAAIERIVIQPVVGGVPEPESWAMLILGFGLVGATARRRRTTPCPVPA